MIYFKEVTLEREEQTLLNHVDLHIGEGEFVYLIGKVGAGKSSLLKSLYAELPISSGSASIFEYDLTHIKRSQIPYLRRRLGIIFQDFQLLVDRTVDANLEFVLRATGWKDRQAIQERIREVLQMVGLETKGYRMPNTLSGGEQQRVVIARALLNKPSLILADEPTGNLDPETGKNIVQLLYDICKNQHTAVLMSTHNLQLLEQFPGRVLRVEDQNLVEENNAPVETEAETSETLEEAVEPITETAETPEEAVETIAENSETPEETAETIAETTETLEEAAETIAETAETPEESAEPVPETAEMLEAATASPQSEATEAIPEETQSVVTGDSDSSSSAEVRCLPSETAPEASDCNERFGQTPSESAAL